MSTNIEVLGATHGIAPRSEALINLGADFERGRASAEQLAEQTQRESEEWLAYQSDQGILIPENGRLFWQDHLRPIVTASNGFAEDIDDGQVTRWFEDNRFYRQPEITGRLSLDYGKFFEEFPPVGENVSLLSPRSFAYLCRNSYPDLPAERNLLQLYSELLFGLEQKGVKRVTFEEYLPPNLQTEQTESIDLLVDWCSDLKISVITPGGQGPIPFRLRPNQGIGLSAKALSSVGSAPSFTRPDFTGGEIWYQAVRVANTGVEVNEIERHLEVIEGLRPARLILTHDVDLEHLPLDIAKDKVTQLSELVTRAGESL